MNSKAYYHNNQMRNVVYDVLNPYRYQKVSDNNRFYLLMTGEKNECVYCTVDFEIFTSAFVLISSKGSGRELRVTAVCCSIK